jgi:hypothetical protein
MSGIDDPHTVDRIVRRTNGQYVLVVASADRAISSREDIKLLVAKLNAYTDFVIDGGLRRQLATDEPLSVAFRIDVSADLSDDALRAITYVEDRLDPYGITVEYAVLPQ